MFTTGAPHLYTAKVAANITVVVPHTNEEGWGFTNQHMISFGPLLREWFFSNGCGDDSYGIWFYTPQAYPLHNLFSPDFVVFDVMDELTMFHNAPKELKEREADLLQTADVVIAGGPSLWAAKSKIRPDTICLPSCVDSKHYSPSRAREIEAETLFEEETKIPHPRIGFFGVIDERLDVELVAKIADANPRWHVVMVGPVVKIDPAILPQRENIHWLGQKDYAILPMIVQGWDVCMLPFALNDSTKFISPTKTLEYMAAEKPIVSTAVHDVVELYGSVVEIGYSHEEFIKHIEHLLKESEVEQAHRLALSNEIVKRSTWDAAAEKVHYAISAVVRR
jgi:glycosyltransferase involved in cell wall biosynthesis